MVFVTSHLITVILLNKISYSDNAKHILEGG